GYVENQNVIIEWRWAEGQYERIPGILAELIGRRVATIAVLGSPAGALIAKAATQAIPIGFSISTDPGELGWSQVSRTREETSQGCLYFRYLWSRSGSIYCIN